MTSSRIRYVGATIDENLNWKNMLMTFYTN